MELLFFVGREKQLASEVAELLEDKCKVLEKLSLYKKEVTLICFFPPLQCMF